MRQLINIRNSISHSFDKQFTDQEMKFSLEQMKEFVEKEFNNSIF